MVSIIVPAYNCEKYISSCIESILSQKEVSIEVIVIDDGSNDSTASILDAYKILDNRLHIFHVENGGPSKARNIGIEKATGDWILFVDADDWVDTNILSDLKLNKDSPDITFFGFKKCYDNAKQDICLPMAFNCTSKEQIFSHLKDLFDNKDEFFGYSVNKIYKSSIIKEHNIRFVEKLNVREDEVFALNYCQYIKSVKALASAPYNYRILENSLSHKQIHFRNYRLLIEIEKKLLTSFPLSDFKNAFLNRLFKYYILSIVECISLNRREKFDVIDEAVVFYNNNKQQIVLPKWQSILFGCPIRFTRCFSIYIAFYLRKFLTKNK